MKISKLLVVVVLLLTGFVDLYGVLIEIEPDKVIKTVELRTSDERFLVKFEFMDVKDFEKIRFDSGEKTVKIKEKLQKLYNDFGRNVPANTKVCFVRFENFGNKKIKIIEESLGRFFRKYGIGPFYSLPKLTTMSRYCCGFMCALGPAVFLLGPFLMIVPAIFDYNHQNLWKGAGIAMLISSVVIFFLVAAGSDYLPRHVRLFSVCALGGAACLLGPLMILPAIFDYNRQNLWKGAAIAMLISSVINFFLVAAGSDYLPRHVRLFSEREDVVPEEGIFFVIDNEFLEKCWEELEKMDLQVEGIAGKVLYKFTSPTDSLSIRVVDEEREEEKSSEDDEYSDEE